MSDVVNLRLARKRAARDKASAQANQSRQTHGISKAARQRADEEREKASQTLDQHHIESGDPR